MINKDVRELFESCDIAAVSTVSCDGAPNVAPIYWKKIASGSTIWFADNFMKQTAENVKDNGKMCVSFWDASKNKGFKLVGEAKHHARGMIFEKAVSWIHSVNPNRNPRGVIEFTVKAAFDQSPGENAGNKLF